MQHIEILECHDLLHGKRQTPCLGLPDRCPDRAPFGRDYAEMFGLAHVCVRHLLACGLALASAPCVSEHEQTLPEMSPKTKYCSPTNSVLGGLIPWGDDAILLIVLLNVLLSRSEMTC
jgi:hypothetical protein